jgi:flagellar protein FliO/FliZ
MSGSPDMMVAGLKMIAALGFVLAILFMLLFALRRLSGGRIGAGKGNRIQIVESHYMGVKKSISLVQVPGKVLVVGITSDRMQLLDTLSEEIEFQQDPIQTPTSFGSMLFERLQKAKGGRKEGENG